MNVVSSMDRSACVVDSFRTSAQQSANQRHGSLQHSLLLLHAGISISLLKLLPTYNALLACLDRSRRAFPMFPSRLSTARHTFRSLRPSGASTVHSAASVPAGLGVSDSWRSARLAVSSFCSTSRCRRWVAGRIVIL